MDICECENFYYSFDLKTDIPIVGRLPDKMQAYIESNIAEVIYESFVIPADQDYLTARLLAQKGLPRAFFWAAAQTIEKYLKAFLLLKGKSVKYERHPIDKLFHDAVEFDKRLLNIDLHPHKDININCEILNRVKNFSLKEFIKDIKTYGCADNRYNSFGIKFDTGHLFALDNFAYTLRELIVLPHIANSFTNVDAELKKNFLDNNPLFCDGRNMCYSKIPSKKFQIKRSFSSTRLEFLIKNKNENNNIFALRWLAMKMKLPKEVLTIIET